MPARERRSDGPQRRPNVFVLAGIGIMNAGALLGGGALGWLVDSRLGTTPAFILLGMVSGIVLGVIASYQKIRTYLND